MPRMAPSITGCIVGLVVAVIVYLILTAVIVFAHSTLVFGLLAALVWLVFTFNWSGFTVRP
jgi:uncharacterized protein YacL